VLAAQRRLDAMAEGQFVGGAPPIPVRIVSTTQEAQKRQVTPPLSEKIKF